MPPGHSLKVTHCNTYLRYSCDNYFINVHMSVCLSVCLSNCLYMSASLSFFLYHYTIVHPSLSQFSTPTKYFRTTCLSLSLIAQARSQGGFGGFDRTPHCGKCILRSTVSTLCHTGLAGDRVHLYTTSSNVTRLAAPRLHKRARRSERADVCNNN